MIDLLQGLSGSISGYFAWVLPSAAAIGVFVAGLWSPIRHLPVARQVDHLDSTAHFLLMGFAALLLGVLLNALSTPLYRVLEGYAWWPKPLFDRGVSRQKEKQRKVRESAASAEQGSLRQDLQYETSRRFPDDEKQVAPTALGNAIRAMELFGNDRYGLDALSLWTELYSIVPQPVRDQYELAKASVDIFVALFWLTVGLGLIALLEAATLESHLYLLLGSVLALLLLRFWYLGSVQAISYWRSASQAIVTLGRKPLAEALALQLPDSVDDEKEMWEVVTRFTLYPPASDEQQAEALDVFRERRPSS